MATIESITEYNNRLKKTVPSKHQARKLAASNFFSKETLEPIRFSVDNEYGYMRMAYRARLTSLFILSLSISKPLESSCVTFDIEVNNMTTNILRFSKDFDCPEKGLEAMEKIKDYAIAMINDFYLKFNVPMM